MLSSENRLLQPRGSPSYRQDCRAVQLRVKRKVCKSFELDCKIFELDCKILNLIASHLNWNVNHLNLTASVVLHLLTFCCLMSTFFSA